MVDPIVSINESPEMDIRPCGVAIEQMSLRVKCDSGDVCWYTFIS